MIEMLPTVAIHPFIRSWQPGCTPMPSVIKQYELWRKGRPPCVYNAFYEDLGPSLLPYYR
jgi:hypothetical protein